MTPALHDLEPKAVWKHFEALSKIPRASGNEAGAREYVLQQAARLGLQATQDRVGNVIIRKPARPGHESSPGAILQGHLDMVCEKDEGTAHDFEKDPIEFRRDGDWLKANGTTLGADNGVGVAAALAVMEAEDISHGPLEFVFTIDEETGLTGASEFAGGVLKSKYFLNLDGEEKGTLCIGCAGGIDTTLRRKVKLRSAGSGSPWRIKVSGLRGGHSGVDIHTGRGNAIRILARALQSALERLPLEVADLRGGSRRNVIPREASAVVLVPAGREQEFKSSLAATEAEVRADLGSFDPDVRITAETAQPPAQVLDPTVAAQIVDLLVSVPHGVLAMSPDIPGLVQTSTNLASIAINGDQVEIGTSQRSAIESSKLAAARMVISACRLAGFDGEKGGGYPGWRPEPDSDIVRQAKQAHTEILGETPRLVAMHAGLECGVIGEKYPGMQMISFGPQIENPHSPNERVEIPSVATFWTYLRGLLEKL